MKVLFDHDSPFLLAHGGFQIQIQQTIQGIAANGVETETLRWWDESQQGDVIHFFGRPVNGYVGLARKKGIKVVILPLLSGVGSRSKRTLFAQRTVFSWARRILPKGFQARIGWDAFQEADAAIANTAWEAHLLNYVFATPTERIHVIGNGIEDVFVNGARVERGRWLVCTATITERKRVLELGRAAVLAKTPVWIIGEAYAKDDPYAVEFFQFAKAHPEIIRYEGGIRDRAKLAAAYRQARGFVLLSDRETLSLSSYEAAACECPLLLSDLPWARTFKEFARYCPVAGREETAKALRAFYDEAPALPAPPKPLSWVQIGAQFKAVYESVLRGK